MSSTSPNLRLPFLDANQNQKTVTHNAALRMLDALVNLHVVSASLSAPPAAPNDGQCWIVASGGTGAWLGKDLNVAAWQDGAWSFYAPNPGFTAFVGALGGALLWNGTAWVSLLGAITALALQTLGVGTGADASNPLSVKANAALFAALPTTASPAGTGDIRVKLSKQASANTASLLFQDAFSGRAEIGLLGDDSFHFKVSPDGASFHDALTVAAYDGAVSFLVSPGAPTPAAGDSSTKLATTAFVAGALAAGTGGSAGSGGTTALATVATGAAGSTIQFGVLEQLVTLSGASTATSALIPNRAIVFAVSSRTVAAVTGAPSYGVGVAGNATQFGGSLGASAGSTNSGVIGPTAFYSPTPVVIAATSGSFTGGAVRIAIQYALFAAPTS